jgi:hypothetical protein
VVYYLGSDNWGEVYGGWKVLIKVDGEISGWIGELSENGGGVWKIGVERVDGDEVGEADVEVVDAWSQNKTN